MFLLYIDPSGAPELSGDRPLYTVVGMCVHEGTWFALEKRVRGLKKKYSCPGFEFELHAKDFCTNIDEQNNIEDFEQYDRTTRRTLVLQQRQAKLKAIADSKRKQLLKKYRQTDPFVHLTRAERSKLLQDGLDLVGSHDGIRLFGEVVDKKHLFVATGQQDSTRHSFAQMVSRFDAFLIRHNHGSSGGPVDNGLLVMDQEPTHEKQIRQIMTGFREQGHPWGPVNHVIELPFFVDSSTASSVQLVDLCAYVLRRYVEKAARSESPEEQNFLRIFHKFDRDGGKLHGLRHYCAKGSCNCKICLERGHTQTLFDVDEAGEFKNEQQP